jgi:hypothetical protein
MYATQQYPLLEVIVEEDNESVDYSVREDCCCRYMDRYAVAINVGICGGLLITLFVLFLKVCDVF